ncbi:MAG: hypothetical protein HEP69_12420 [Aestuariivita sp.]|nr:hypothetical protein [Aestuariivita sp.]
MLHIALASLLVWLGNSAVWANTVGFPSAFWVSFLVSPPLYVHYTFPQTSCQISVAARRFVVTSLVGIVINQAVLVLLVEMTGLSDYLALLVAVAVAAALTFVLCRSWVFRLRQSAGTCRLTGWLGPVPLPSLSPMAMRQRGLRSRLGTASSGACRVFPPGSG